MEEEQQGGDAIKGKEIYPNLVQNRTEQNRDYVAPSYGIADLWQVIIMIDGNHLSDCESPFDSYSVAIQYSTVLHCTSAPYYPVPAISIL